MFSVSHSVNCMVDRSCTAVGCKPVFEATSRQLALLRLEILVNYLKCICLDFERIQSKPS